MRHPKPAELSAVYEAERGLHAAKRKCDAELAAALARVDAAVSAVGEACGVSPSLRLDSGRGVWLHVNADGTSGEPAKFEE